MYKPQDCIGATSLLLWACIFKCTITVVWVLVILGTLSSQHFSRILEETLDIISFMQVHCEDSRGHRQIGVVLRYVFVQIPFPKHLFTPRTPYGHVRTGFWKFWLFPHCRLPSIFVRWCHRPVGLCLLDQLTVVCRSRGFGLKPHIAPIHGVWVLSWIHTMQVSNTTQHTWELRCVHFVVSKQIIRTL